MKDRIYNIRSNWGRRPQTPVELGAQMLETLDRLGRLEPAMSNWVLMDMVTYALVPIKEAGSKIADFVAHNVYVDDDGEPDPAAGGYYLLALGAETDIKVLTSRTVEVTADVGSQSSNDLSFGIGDINRPPDPDLITYATYRRALDILGSIWPCPWLEAGLSDLDFPPEPPITLPEIKLPPPTPRDAFHFPWILYLSAPMAAGLTPPDDIVCERTPGGGVVLSAVRDRLDRDNPDHIRRSRLLQAVVKDRIDIHRCRPSVAPNLPPREGPF